MRAAVSDHRQVVGRAGSALGLDEQVPATRLGCNAPRGLGLAAIAAEARGDILVFVDADHILASDWIAIAIDCLKDPTVAGAGSPYYAPAGGYSATPST